MFDRPARISFVGVAMARKYGLLSGCTALTKFMMDESWVRVAFKIIGAHGYDKFRYVIYRLDLRDLCIIPASFHISGSVVLSLSTLSCAHLIFNAGG